MEKLDNKDLLSLLCSIILPPLGVFIKFGLKSSFWINLILTILGFYILGLIHAFYVILKK
jgi:uncharacterized membrane protein YqaE (UPF0057 family)